MAIENDVLDNLLIRAESNQERLDSLPAAQRLAALKEIFEADVVWAVTPNPDDPDGGREEIVEEDGAPKKPVVGGVEQAAARSRFRCGCR